MLTVTRIPYLLYKYGTKKAETRNVTLMTFPSQLIWSRVKPNSDTTCEIKQPQRANSRAERTKADAPEFAMGPNHTNVMPETIFRMTWTTSMAVRNRHSVWEGGIW